jgi:predicted phage-related endonuclease
MKEFKNGAFPDTYYTQCVHYMMVTGCKKWYLAVLVLNKEFMVFEIERDEEEIKALAEAEANFWECVKSQTPPPTDGSSSTTESIKTIFPHSNDEIISLFGHEDSLKQYQAIGNQIKELKTLQDQMANNVKAFMGEVGKGESDSFKVSWLSSERNTFDAKKFAADHPNLDLSQYYKQSVVRTFRVTEKN